ncbi:MAG: homoserine dehydrogenase [Elusimicrobia bacterium]|nr:homoserine dehydrogenase [Elusimicrobiota bacterium]
MDTPGIALIGLGTVGQGVVQLLQRQWPMLQKITQGKLRLLWACDHHARGSIMKIPRIGDIRVSRTPKAALRDVRVNIVIELIGGLNEARRIVIQALETRRHVITANKLLLSTCWSELHEAGARGGRRLLFEASVASGLPIIKSMQEGLISSQIWRIRGILNGTTNYILTRMEQDGLDFKSALAQAQQRGFAEADPSMDIEGRDSAAKLSILASLALGRWVAPETIACRGLRGVELLDIQFAHQQLNRSVRLLGNFEITKSLRLCLWVRPCLIPRPHPLAAVYDEYNAIALATDAAGDLYFQGQGAGSLPAASAVVADLINLIRHWDHPVQKSWPLMAAEASRIRLAPEPISAYYLRAEARDRPGTLSQLTALLGRNNISIRHLYQQDWPGHLEKSGFATVIIITHPARPVLINKILQEARMKNHDISIKTSLPLINP